MDSCMGDGGFLRRVSPFRHPRIYGYLRLPAAFRSLSRLSSALSAKASTLRSWSFNLSSFPYSHGLIHSPTEMADGICIPSLPFTSSVMLLGSSAWSASASQVFRLSRLPFRPGPMASGFLLRQLFLFSDVLFISFANLIIRFVQYSVFKVRTAIALQRLYIDSFNISAVMEIKGFEPLTPCLQGRCSPI